MNLVKAVLNRRLNEDDQKSLRERIHNKMQMPAAMAIANDSHKYLKRPGELPYPNFNHEEFYLKTNELKDAGDFEGLERYLDTLNESQDDDNNVFRPTFGQSRKPPPDKPADVYSFEKAFWNKVSAPKAPVSGADPNFDDYMKHLDDMRRGVQQNSKPAKTKTPELRMRDRVKNAFLTTTNNLMNELENHVSGKNYIKGIKETFAENAKSHELYGGHNHLARSHAMLNSHDPNYFNSELSQRITKHLGSIMEHPDTEHTDRNHIINAQHLGDVEGRLGGSATSRSEFDKYD